MISRSEKSSPVLDAASVAAPNAQRDISSPIRVAHIITRMIVGGAQENTLLSVEGLHKRGDFDVTLISGVDGGPEGDLLSRARRTTKLIVVPELARRINPVADLRALWRLVRVLRRGRFHIVHTHSSKAGVLGRTAAMIARTPIVVHTLHSLVFHDYQPWIVNRSLRLIKKICAPMTDHFISVSEVIRQKAIATRIVREDNSSTIYSGMELEWFLRSDADGARVRRDLGIPPDAPVIGKVARLFTLKGHDQLLDAAPLIVKRYPNVRFLLIGDGILYDELLARVEKLGLRQNFIFAGFVDREKIPGRLAAMDIVVHTSLREGLARVLPQALAMGKPCVTFDLDGAPEVVIPGKTGFLVRVGDSEGLADSVATLIKDAAMRTEMGRAGRALVDPAFRAETMVDRIAAVYHDLLIRHDDRIRRFDRRW